MISNDEHSIPARIVVRETINDLVMTMYWLPSDAGYLLEIYWGSHLVRVTKINNVSEFQAGRVFEREWGIYKASYGN